MPAGVLSVARPRRWGNPYRVGPNRSAAEAVALYRVWLAERIAIEPTFLDELRGHGLACWCRLDKPCHADVLNELANG